MSTLHGRDQGKWASFNEPAVFEDANRFHIDLPGESAASEILLHLIGC